MFSSSSFFFCQFCRQEMEFQGWNICNVMPAKQKRKKQQMPAVSLSLLMSGILVFVSVKLSVFVGLHHLILLVLRHTGKERKCLHHGFNPDFPRVKKIVCFLETFSYLICQK